MGKSVCCLAVKREGRSPLEIQTLFLVCGNHVCPSVFELGSTIDNIFLSSTLWKVISQLQKCGSELMDYNFYDAKKEIDCTKSHLFSKRSLTDLPAADKHLLDDCGSFFGAYR